MIINHTIITQSGQTIKAGTNIPIIPGMLVVPSQVLHDDWWQTYEIEKPMKWQHQHSFGMFSTRVSEESNLGNSY
jgi:hypothetical protein